MRTNRSKTRCEFTYRKNLDKIEAFFGVRGNAIVCFIVHARVFTKRRRQDNSFAELFQRFYLAKKVQDPTHSLQAN